MKVRFLSAAAAVASILLLLAAAPVELQAQNSHRAHYMQVPPAQPQQPQPPTAPPASAAPPATDLKPANPPQVAFNNGVLTITANNSTLGDILRAVHHQTGASVDVPGNATERVVGQFGPGPARDVMASLLNGSHFNYVLLGSETDPSGLNQVVLISKSFGGEESPVQQARFAPRAAPTPQPADNADANDDDAAADTMPEGEAADEQANQAQSGEDPAQEHPPGQPAIKTPEQLLQELQQRQQQMQQQGAPVPPQNYPPPNVGTNPPK